MLTWCDGLSDVELDRLRAFHERHGRIGTLTAVHPPGRFGRLALSGDRVVAFQEKIEDPNEWINGAFFVFNPGVFDYIDGDATQFEREPLERLAADGELMAYRHEAFWQCMDTGKEVQVLNALWDSGRGTLEGVELRPMRVLLTGNEGYIGTILVPWLWARGYEVVGSGQRPVPRVHAAARSAPVPTIRKDIRDVEAGDLDGIDAVIHLAGLSNDPLGNLSAAADLRDQSRSDGAARRARQARRHPPLPLRLDAAASTAPPATTSSTRTAASIR